MERTEVQQPCFSEIHAESFVNWFRNLLTEETSWWLVTLLETACQEIEPSYINQDENDLIVILNECNPFALIPNQIVIRDQ